MTDINIRNLRMGDALKADGYIDDEMIKEALAFQQTNQNMRLGEILIHLGYITEEILLKCLARHLNLRIIDLKQFTVDIDAVSTIPRIIADKYDILVISRSETDIFLAASHTLNYQALEEVRTFTPLNIKLVLCYKSEIEDAINYNYSELSARSAVAGVRGAAQSLQELDFDIIDEDDDTPVVRLVNSILHKGFSVGATDIHIEPYENELLIRLRVDGIITEYETVDFGAYNSLIARIKVMSGMDIAEKRLPQDGQFRYRMGERMFNIRTSVIPTIFGEKAVLRFLDMKTQIVNAEHFGMNEANYKKAMRILQNPHGIIYVSGATGSGKTTTMYFFLEYMSKKNISIVSVEDPVERKMRRVAQIQVNPAAGLTFLTGLRAILRQDPDIIMVGETRDEETATMSVRAAITGHLVLSTIHTNSAISTISRLIDMGIPPYMVASSITGLIAQRLVRKLCPLCKRMYEPNADELEILGIRPEKLYRNVGCKDCNHTGYKGRVAVHEIVEIDQKIRRMITELTDISDIQKYCVTEKGMRLLSDETKQLILDGVTTVSEYVRVVSSME